MIVNKNIQNSFECYEWWWFATIKYVPIVPTVKKNFLTLKYKIKMSVYRLGSTIILVDST